jgi:hypothetical protein
MAAASPRAVASSYLGRMNSSRAVPHDAMMQGFKRLIAERRR